MTRWVCIYNILVAQKFATLPDEPQRSLSKINATRRLSRQTCPSVSGRAAVWGMPAGCRAPHDAQPISSRRVELSLRQSIPWASASF